MFKLKKGKLQLNYDSRNGCNLFDLFWCHWKRIQKHILQQVFCFMKERKRNITILVQFMFTFNSRFQAHTLLPVSRIQIKMDVDDRTSTKTQRPLMRCHWTSTKQYCAQDQAPHGPLRGRLHCWNITQKLQNRKTSAQYGGWDQKKVRTKPRERKTKLRNSSVRKSTLVENAIESMQVSVHNKNTVVRQRPEKNRPHCAGKNNTEGACIHATLFQQLMLEKVEI